MNKEEKSGQLKWPIIAVICILGLWIAWWIGILIFRSEEDGLGTLGDAFGSLTSMFTGLAFVGLVFSLLQQSSMIKQQREDLKIQHELLSMQRKEMEGQKEALNSQHDAMLELNKATSQQTEVMIQEIELTKKTIAIMEEQRKAEVRQTQNSNTLVMNSNYTADIAALEAKISAQTALVQATFYLCSGSRGWQSGDAQKMGDEISKLKRYVQELSTLRKI